ncbi:MAG: hypothetical protein HY275_02850 [Gemmatimonadetes bacterium]|nr:hypothetical protein [Gemmatimonadota bacterium]
MAATSLISYCMATMEDVHVVVPQGALQVAPGRAFHPGDLEVPALLQEAGCLLDARALLRDVQRRQVARARHEGEDVDRGRDRERVQRPLGLDVADERRLGGEAEVVARGRIVEKLPRQAGQLRRVDAEAHAEALARLAGRVLAATIGELDRRVEQGAEELRAEVGHDVVAVGGLAERAPRGR